MAGLSTTLNSKAVLTLISSSEDSEEISVRTKPPSLNSKTAFSVIILLTTPYPEIGRLQLPTSFDFPLLVCSVATTILLPLTAKSIALPIPVTDFPGTPQLARSPVPLT